MNERYDDKLITDTTNNKNVNERYNDIMTTVKVYVPERPDIFHLLSTSVTVRRQTFSFLQASVIL